MSRAEQGDTVAAWPGPVGRWAEGGPVGQQEIRKARTLADTVGLLP